MKPWFVSDLDGTLLNKDAQLSDFAFRQLCDLMANGLLFTFATARSAFSAKRLIGEVPIHLPVIELGGAYLSDFQTGEHLRVHAIEPEVALQVEELMSANGFASTFSTFDGEADHLFLPPATNEGMAWYWRDRIHFADHRVRELKDRRIPHRETVVSMTIIGQENEVEVVRRAVVEQLGSRVQLQVYHNLYHRGWYWLTVHGATATKDQGLRDLMEVTGLELEHLTVFGDEANDVGMFEFAPRAVAVANALPAVKELATHHIGHHHDDAVVNYSLEAVGGK